MLDREKRVLFQKKANKPSKRARMPLKSEGAEGDFVLGRIKEGIFLFFKGMGSWLKLFHSSADMVPEKSLSYNLGSPTRRFKHAFFGPDSIYIGDVKLSSEGIKDSAKLVVKTSTGKIVSEESEALQVLDGDVELSDTSAHFYAVDTSVIQDGNTLTINEDVDFSVVALDPSADEEVRIDNRLRFDAEMSYSLANLHTKVDWLEQEVGERTKGYFNRFLHSLSGGDDGTELSNLLGYNQLNNVISQFNTKLTKLAIKSKLIDIINPILQGIYIRELQTKAAIEANNATIATWTQSLKAAYVEAGLEVLPDILYASDFTSVGNMNTTAFLTDEGLSAGAAMNINALDTGVTLLTPQEGDDFSIPAQRPTIGGTWSFDYTGNVNGDDVWISTEAHGLWNGNKIIFINSASAPQEFSSYKTYEVVRRTSTVIQLKAGTGEGAVIEGTADSSSSWEMTYATDPESTLGGLPYSVEYGNAGEGHDMKPDLVADEDYTTGGVCSLSQYHTSDACIRGGGTWYPLETINDNT